MRRTDAALFWPLADTPLVSEWCVDEATEFTGEALVTRRPLALELLLIPEYDDEDGAFRRFREFYA